MVTASKILLVEDDPILGEGLVMALKLEGYQVDWRKTVKSGHEQFQSTSHEVIILDINLPDGQGTDLCKLIREENQSVAIIFLTAKTDEETVVKGLEIGANDFVKKPFSHRELMARIKVYLRHKVPSSKEISIGDLHIIPEKRQVTFKDEIIPVNRRQFDILSFFLTRPDQIITREHLLGHLDQDGNIYDRTVDSHLSQLRKLLKAHEINHLQIISIYGIGYRLEILE